MNLNRLSRKLHRWGAILIVAPVLLVIVTGLLLQVKKQWSWVQPPTQKGSSDVPQMTFDEILSAARSVPEAKPAPMQIETETWRNCEKIFSILRARINYR